MSMKNNNSISKQSTLKGLEGLSKTIARSNAVVFKMWSVRLDRKLPGRFRAQPMQLSKFIVCIFFISNAVLMGTGNSA